MELSELQGLSKDYGAALLEELERKQSLSFAEEELKEAEVFALKAASDAGEIYSRNAEVRKLQLSAAIADSVSCRRARSSIDTCQCEVDNARAECARLDAEIGLTKAWLYSQARIG